MANSKNTKKDRDEKRSGDLSELNDSFSSYGTESDSESETDGSEFISKYSSSSADDEKDYSKSAYASKINKSYGESTKSKNKSEEEDDDDYSYTSQLGTDQRPRKGEQYKTGSNKYSGSQHQLSYDQQGRYQQPAQYQQQYGQGYTQQYNQPYGNQSQNYGNQDNQQAYSNQGYNPGFQNQNQPYGFNQQQGNPYPSNQGQFQSQGYNQQPYNASQQFGQQQYRQSNQPYNQPQGYNQAYNYGNQFENQQFVNRGYENHNYNEQNNGLRSSYNTQGFGNSIYRHENDHPEYGGSGYAGTTFGGQGSGEFRSNEHNYQHPYGNQEFSSRRDFRNPSRGYTRNYRQDEQQRNSYQHDEDGLKGFQGNYGQGYENSYNSPYGNEREEQYGYEREFSNYGRNARPYNEERNFEDQKNGHNYERSYGQQFDRSNRRNRSKRNYK